MGCPRLPRESLALRKRLAEPGQLEAAVTALNVGNRAQAKLVSHSHKFEVDVPGQAAPLGSHCLLNG